jgi:hypothetical protein
VSQRLRYGGFILRLYGLSHFYQVYKKCICKVRSSLKLPFVREAFKCEIKCMHTLLNHVSELEQKQKYFSAKKSVLTSRRTLEANFVMGLEECEVKEH